MSKIEVNKGDRYGRLTIISELPKSTDRRIFECKCDCGATGIYKLMLLRSGKTKSCGCKRKDIFREMITKHGKSDSRLYKIWSKMKERCSNPNSNSYIHYGGRDIEFCQEWTSYEAFQEWAITNGYVKGKSIERIQVNGNYDPSNCEWIDLKLQSRNKRNSIYIKHKGEAIHIMDLADETGKSYSTLYREVQEGKLEKCTR